MRGLSDRGRTFILPDKAASDRSISMLWSSLSRGVLLHRLAVNEQIPLTRRKRCVSCAVPCYKKATRECHFNGCCCGKVLQYDRRLCVDSHSRSSNVRSCTFFLHFFLHQHHGILAARNKFRVKSYLCKTHDWLKELGSHSRIREEDFRQWQCPLEMC